MARQMIARACLIPALLGLAAGCRTSPKPREVLNRWLTRNCGVGERGQLESQLRQMGGQVERGLMDAFRQGPPAGEIEAVLAAAEQDYDEVQAALRAGKARRLSPDDLGALKAVSKTSHLAAVRRDYVFSYRAAALAGLAIAGRPDGLTLLRQTASDPQSPFQHVAALALRRQK